MQEFLNNIIPNVMAKLPDFYAAIGDTLLMVVWSGAISFVLGLTLGVLITVTKPGGILENKVESIQVRSSYDRSSSSTGFRFPRALRNASINEMVSRATRP